MIKRSWPVSVRARAAMVAAAVVAVALALGALGLVSLLRSSLEEGVEGSARLEVATVASLARRGELPRPLPAGRGDLVAEVVTRQGAVLATTVGVVHAVPLTAFPNGAGDSVVRLASIPVGEAELGPPELNEGPDGPYMVVSSEILLAGAGGSRTVAVEVATSLASSWQAVGELEEVLAIGLPILTLLVGVVVLVLASWALSPVDRIRREVADITLSDMGRRVPEPRAKDEVGRLASTMNAMLDRLESSASRQRRFVADASHELRTPLTALEATLEVALAHPGTLPWSEAAGKALESTRRLSSILDELLLLARLDEGQLLVGSHQLVDLDEVVLVEIALCELPDGIGLDVSRLCAGRILGDQGSLRRVVRNLLENAFRHAGSTVSVELSTGQEHVELVVADDGLGIPKTAREAVFQRFTRLDDARARDQGGTGLGLALVREIVEAHGGSVRVEDACTGARLVAVFPRPDG